MSKFIEWENDSKEETCFMCEKPVSECECYKEENYCPDNPTCDGCDCCKGEE